MRYACITHQGKTASQWIAGAEVSRVGAGFDITHRALAGCVIEIAADCAHLRIRRNTGGLILSLRCITENDERHAGHAARRIQKAYLGDQIGAPLLGIIGSP